MGTLATLERARRRTSALLGNLAFLPLTLARLTLGFEFVGTGLGKVGNLAKVTAFFTELGIPLPAFNAFFASWTELVGGALLLVGLGARFAAIPVATTMIVAMLTAVIPGLKHWWGLFGSIELVLFALCVYVAIGGAGPLSLDALIEAIRKSRAKRPLAAGAKKTRVVVLGGGFAGVYTAKYLTEYGEERGDVEVELLSEENYFVFQPLLPEVAAGGIAATHVVNPIREIVPAARFRCCRITGVGFDDKRVFVSQGQGLEHVAVPYDHLVFCLGKVSNFSQMPGVAEHALAMKDLSDAFKLRNHVIRCLELADIEQDPAQKAALLTFVVAGGGFSGVETIGELHELVLRSLKYFPRIERSEVRFKLIHAQKTVLPEMTKKLGEAARRILERRGIELVLEARLRSASREHVYLADGRSIASRTFVCTVGNAPNPVAKRAMTEGGLQEAKMGERGLGIFRTDRALRCIGDGREGYWAVGDCAGIPNPNGEGFSPPTAQFAIREAKACAKNIFRTIDRQKLEDFRFKALGMLASLGQRSAVAEMLGVELTGFFAWFAWRTIYLSKLPGNPRRLRVALDWTLDLFFPRDITQLQVFRSDRLNVQHFEPGEVVVRKGQIGRELFMIVSGEVEVLGGNGKGESIIATLGAREVFGEKALLEDTHRTATVRAKSATQVLVMSRSDFRSMVENFPVLHEHFAKLMKDRYPDEMGDAQLEAKVRADGHTHEADLA